MGVAPAGPIAVKLLRRGLESPIYSEISANFHTPLPPVRGPFYGRLVVADYRVSLRGRVGSDLGSRSLGGQNSAPKVSTFFITVDFEKLVQHLPPDVAHPETLVCPNKPGAYLACKPGQTRPWVRFGDLE